MGKQVLVWAGTLKRKPMQQIRGASDATINCREHAVKLTCDQACECWTVCLRLTCSPIFSLSTGLQQILNFDAAVDRPGVDSSARYARTEVDPGPLSNSHRYKSTRRPRRLTDNVDLRALEYGAAGGSSSNNKAAFAFLSTGVVFHLPPARHP